MFKSRWGICFPVLALALALTGWNSASAQQVFGNILGTVTDASGGAVANAKVTITDASKGTQFVVMTDASGNYNKGQLIPDAYTVSIEAVGFQKVVSNGLDIHVDESVRFDTQLKVGQESTTVEVTASAPLLQTDRADVAQTFSAEQINDLPNIGRNAQSMELLNPGTAKIGWQHASDENPQGSVQMVADGQLFDSMGYELDGTTNQDPILGIIVINPTFDSLSEIKQATQNFDAEFEYAANMASYSTKSGSNTFHADAFEYLQINTPGFKTFAADPFNNLPTATYRQNQYGGSIGGRIIKDKLFFFGDAQLNREAQGGSVVTSVPTAQNRLGNFSDYLNFNSQYQIYDPSTGNQSDGTGRTAFTGNIIPASKISPQAAAILNYFPLPNFTPQFAGEDYANNFAENGNTAITANQWDTREDYYLNEKNTIFGRYSYAAFTESAPGAFGSTAGGPAFGHYAGSSKALNQSISLGWTDTISPTVVNEARFGYMRYHVFDVPNGYGTQPATTAGIPGLNLDNTYTSGLPAFYINNPHDTAELGYALGVNQCNCPLTQTETQYQFIDNLTKIVGNHTLKFGADIRYAQNLRVPSDNHRAGELTFAGPETGDVTTAGTSPSPGVGMATFLLGDVTSFNRYVSSSTNAQESQPRLFFYAQDAWHPSPKWTLNLGMRYELVPPETVNGAGNGATFDLQNGLMYVFGYGNSVSSHGIQTTNYHDFAPRVGIAYQLNEKTVIRAGYGWTYDLGVFGSNFGHNVTQNPPVLYNQVITNNNPFAGVFNLAQGPAAPAPIVVGSNGTFPLPVGISPKFRPATVTLPQLYQYNASIQRQITSKVSATGAYVGNSNRHGFLGTGNEINPNEAEFVPGGSPINPYANIIGNTSLGYYCDCANEQYNSFQGTVNVKALSGWTLQGNYTYQRQYGPGWAYDSNYYFIYDRAAGYGNGGVLPRQQITLAQNYDIPVGKGRKYMSSMNKVADAVIGGWNISGITTFYSGFPFSPAFANNYAGKPNAGPNNRPDQGSGFTYDNTRAQWFTGCPDGNCTSGAFLYPAANTFGTYPINTLFGPRFIQQDLSMSKTFKITEKLGFALRADASNVLNHTNLGLPNSNVDQSSAGQISGIAAGATMRRMQFSGTLRF
jgi:hypothetical protein